MENKYKNYKCSKKKQFNQKDKEEVSSVDLHDKRVIILSGDIDDKTAINTVELLLKMDACNHKDITMFLSSPGGSVYAGFLIYDVMNLIKSKIRTIGFGRISSMATILLINGTKGKRCILPNSSVMIHEVNTFTEGKVTELNERLKHTRSLNDRLVKVMASKTNRSAKQISEYIVNKDYWMDAKTALKYGFVDKVLENE